MNVNLVLRRIRLTIAIVIVVATGGLIAATRLTSGMDHRTAQLILINTLNAGSIVVLGFVLGDAVLSALKLVVAVVRKGARAGIVSFTRSLAADLGLLILAYSAELALLSWRG